MPKTNSVNMLRFLDALLKHGNFTRAAKDLYISQPYLTQTIQTAEKELGLAIIDRDATPLTLTPGGRLYYQHLTALENETTQFQKQLKHYAHPDKQVIKIGVLSSLGYYLLPLVLPAYQRVHPESRIELVEDISERNEQRLLHGELDFLLGQNPETIAPGLTIHDRGRDGYYAVIPASSRLYRAEHAYLNPGTVPIERLLAEPLIVSPQGSSIRRQLDYLFSKYHLTPNIAVESTNTLTITKLAQAGMGVTLLPDSVHVQPDAERYNLYPLPEDLIALNYFIAFPMTKTLTPAEKDLVTIFLTNLESSLAANSSIPS
ncbi:LysR family transcriptional regulator [Lactiplantibacillus garii]|uniref:LysR family transcriptional regulator n=1 Tax=Lactiplantibacillus garii TaxID=2306423 RepID=A0A3R8L116_9LACO|nr:LysR family transcriptional regulator [Lactiplantibacillus garii]RRK10446.1 LysR family transcriptional regulator [Lactiplantibacillus garii]